MKTLPAITLLFIVVALSNCKKSDDAVALTNCDNLVTDTTSTGDTAAIYIQNAFTPNGDHLNDVNRVVTRGIASITFSVYDNNNTIVYTTSQLSVPDLHWLAVTDAWAPASTSTYETYHYRIQATTNSNHHIGACGELYKLACLPANISLSSLHFEDQLLLNGTYTSTSMESLSTCP